MCVKFTGEKSGLDRKFTDFDFKINAALVQSSFTFVFHLVLQLIVYLLYHLWQGPD